MSNSLPPDERIIKGLQRGDETAQEDFVNRYVPILKGFLKNRFGLLNADANEVVQDTLYKAIVNIHKYELGRGGKFDTWVFEIAKNAAIDWRRKNVKHDLLVHGFEDFPQEIIEATSDEELGERGRLMRKALTYLDPTDRKILGWVCHDVKLVEVAKYLGMEEGTVRQRKRRALIKLKKVYEDLLGGD